MPSKPNTNPWPVLGLLYAATLWGVIWYPLRLLERAGMHGAWTTLVSYGSALLLGAWPVWRRRTEFRRAPGLLVLLALAGGWCNLAFIIALLEGAVVRVLLLFHLSPLWAVLMGWWFLGERLTRQALAVVATALAGAAVMLWDPALDVPWPWGRADWLALSSGFAFALSNVLVRRLQEVSVVVKTGATWLGVLGVTAAGLLGLRVPAPADPGVWAGAAALGVFGIATMTLTVQYGVTRMPVHRSAVILLFELVAGALSSQLLTDEVVRLREWIGGLLILTAAYGAARVRMEAEA